MSVIPGCHGVFCIAGDWDACLSEGSTKSRKHSTKYVETEKKLLQMGQSVARKEKGTGKRISKFVAKFSLEDVRNATPCGTEAEGTHRDSYLSHDMPRKLTTIEHERSQRRLGTSSGRHRKGHLRNCSTCRTLRRRWRSGAGCQTDDSFQAIRDLLIFGPARDALRPEAKARTPKGTIRFSPFPLLALVRSTEHRGGSPG